MKITPLFLLLFSFSYLFAQNCEVKIDSLKGSYTGECYKGMANGNGTAVGIDIYAGNFKNGYPDGNGKYTWKNGNWYDGYWKKGLFEGEGTLHVAKTITTDSSELKGYWAKGKYIGNYKVPFSVDILSNRINEANVRKSGKAGDDIILTVKSITGGGLTLIGGSIIKNDSSNTSSNTIAKPRLTDIQVLRGSYLNKFDDEYSPISNKYTFKQVEFPISFYLSFDSERVKIDIYEKGNWVIDIKLDK